MSFKKSSSGKSRSINLALRARAPDSGKSEEFSLIREKGREREREISRIYLLWNYKFNSFLTLNSVYKNNYS